MLFDAGGKPTATAIATFESKEVSAQPADSLENFIMRAASDKSFDVEKLERLIALQERSQAAQRKERFYESLAAVQAQIPQMDQNGCIDYGQNKGKINYARLEDIDAAIRPIYSKYGFSVRWTSFPVMDGKLIRVVGTFTAHGHSEESEMTGPPDASGGKNEAQRGPSGASYLKRHITKQFWNIVERGKDMDGARVRDLLPITDKQADEIDMRLKDCGADIARFKKVFVVDRIADLKAGQLKEVYVQIEKKEREFAAKQAAQ
jgi:hypothetical protein